jgi:hypothetical protein
MSHVPQFLIGLPGVGPLALRRMSGQEVEQLPVAQLQAALQLPAALNDDASVYFVRKAARNNPACMSVATHLLGQAIHACPQLAVDIASDCGRAWLTPLMNLGDGFSAETRQTVASRICARLARPKSEEKRDTRYGPGSGIQADDHLFTLLESPAFADTVVGLPADVVPEAVLSEIAQLRDLGGHDVRLAKILGRTAHWGTIRACTRPDPTPLHAARVLEAVGRLAAAVRGGDLRGIKEAGEGADAGKALQLLYNHEVFPVTNSVLSSGSATVRLAEALLVLAGEGNPDCDRLALQARRALASNPSVPGLLVESLIVGTGEPAVLAHLALNPSPEVEVRLASIHAAAAERYAFAHSLSPDGDSGVYASALAAWKDAARALVYLASRSSLPESVLSALDAGPDEPSLHAALCLNVALDTEARERHATAAIEAARHRAAERGIAPGYTAQITTAAVSGTLPATILAHILSLPEASTFITADDYALFAERWCASRGLTTAEDETDDIASRVSVQGGDMETEFEAWLPAMLAALDLRKEGLEYMALVDQAEALTRQVAAITARLEEVRLLDAQWVTWRSPDVFTEMRETAERLSPMLLGGGPLADHARVSTRRETESLATRLYLYGRVRDVPPSESVPDGIDNSYVRSGARDLSALPMFRALGVAANVPMPRFEPEPGSAGGLRRSEYRRLPA